MVKEVTAVSIVLLLIALVAAGGLWELSGTPTGAQITNTQTRAGPCSGPCTEGLPPGYCEGRLQWTGTECVCRGKPLPQLPCGSPECPLTKTAVCVNNIPQCPTPQDCSALRDTRCWTARGGPGYCLANCACEPSQIVIPPSNFPSATTSEPGAPASSFGPLTNPCPSTTVDNLFKTFGKIYDCFEGTMIDPVTGEKRIMIGFTKNY